MSDGSRMEALVEELGIVVANDRDRSGLSWLLEQIGEAGIREAVASLVGGRRAYVSNIAKAAGVEIPADVRRAGAQADGAAALRGIRGILTESGDSTGDRMVRYRGR